MTAETRKELHATLDAILNAIERTGACVSVELSDTLMAVVIEDGADCPTLGFEITDKAAAKTIREIIDDIGAVNGNKQDLHW